MKRKIVQVPGKGFFHIAKRGATFSIKLECGHWETATRTEIRRGWCYCFRKECKADQVSERQCA